VPIASSPTKRPDPTRPNTTRRTSPSVRQVGSEPYGGRQVAVGKGSIDWAKTFTAAKTGGVRNYFVEQTMELTRQSVAALKAMM